MHNIQDPSIFYDSLRALVRATYPYYFGKIEVSGIEHIPENEPVIFAANHQCGLIDPLTIILSQNKPIVYLARADIFKSKLNAWFLRKIKVAPIYRIRDGYENLSKNEEQLQLAVQVLLNKRSLGMMPEGNHGEFHALRPLVKGLFRVAYAAESALKGEAHVKIVPVGIDQSAYQHSGSHLMMQFGAPIDVQDYLPVYLENPAAGLNVLKERLEKDLSSLMQDVRSSNYQDIYELSCYGADTYIAKNRDKQTEGGFRSTEGKRFEARRALTPILEKLEQEDPSSFNTLTEWSHMLRGLPGDPNSKANFMAQKNSNMYDISCWTSCMLALPGMLLNAPARKLVHRIMSGVEDKQMYHTFAFTIGLLVNLLVYPIITLLLSILLKLTFLKGLALFLLVLTFGIYGERIRQYTRMYWKLFRYRWGKKNALLKNSANAFAQINAQILKLLNDK